MEEIWKSVSGYETRYFVSSLGRVKGPTGKATHGVKGSRGYMQISLRHAGQRASKVRNIHVLVAEEFIGPRPDGYHVCHADGDKTNNSLQNLRYDTAAANWEDFRNAPGRTSHAIARTHCPTGHELQEPNLMVSQLIRGWRSCLACSRAHAYLKNGKNKNAFSFEDLANIYYERILNDQ
jgi:hypothetical protein